MIDQPILLVKYIANLKTGEVLAWAGSIAPAGWQLFDSEFEAVHFALSILADQQENPDDRR
jgi:hypothetical protein